LSGAELADGMNAEEIGGGDPARGGRMAALQRQERRSCRRRRTSPFAARRRAWGWPPYRGRREGRAEDAGHRDLLRGGGRGLARGSPEGMPTLQSVSQKSAMPRKGRPECPLRALAEAIRSGDGLLRYTLQHGSGAPFGCAQGKLRPGPIGGRGGEHDES